MNQDDDQDTDAPEAAAQARQKAAADPAAQTDQTHGAARPATTVLTSPDAGSAALCQLLSAQPRLFRQLIAFNYQPADYLHPGRRAHFVQPFLNPLIWQEARARRPLSALILQQLGLEQRPCFDPGQKIWAIVLLEQGRLLRLARHVGAVLLGPQARSSVSREEVLAWKERLTPEAYQFMMNSASLLPQVKTDSSIDGTLPVETLGYGWIARCLEDTPDELRLRANLKFPPDTPSQTVSRARAAQVVHAVFSTLEPKWISSFATLRP